MKVSERRLKEQAVDQIERTLELAQRASGRMKSPLLKETERVKQRLQLKLRRFGTIRRTLREIYLRNNLPNWAGLVDDVMNEIKDTLRIWEAGAGP